MQKTLTDWKYKIIRSQSIVFGLVLLVVFSISLSAGVPTAINYQGFLTDGSGSPVSDNSYSIQFSIYDAALGGTSKWTETKTVSTSDGLFAVLLGTMNPITDSVFNGPTSYLSIKVGADPEMVPRTIIVTVPFAMRVSTVDGSTGGAISGILHVTGKANIGDGNTNDGIFPFVAGEGSDATGD